MSSLRIDSFPAATPESRPVVPRLGIMNDYVRIPYANGSSFASQFLYREFKKRGSEVTVIGPRDPAAQPADLPPRHVCLPSVPFRNHPGLHLPLPGKAGLQQIVDANLSVAVAQTSSAFLQAGLWLRRAHGVPLVCVNTVHLPSVYDVVLPRVLQKNPLADRLFQGGLIPWAEGQVAQVFNGSDGLVVLSEGLESYWRERGVTAPIHVIPRSVEPSIFDQRPVVDPYPRWAKHGARLLVVCRHTREKSVERLLDIFARHIVPHSPDVSLTLVGDGPDHDYFKAHARQLGVFDRCVWPGEVTLTDTPSWYRHADVFVYASLSETYGQVVSEALWCGLPAVAFDDSKGVADQINHASDGFLLNPDRVDADESFGNAVVRLVGDRAMREAFSARAQAKARRRSDPRRCIARYEEVFAAAKEHHTASMRDGRGFSVIEQTTPLVRWAAQMTLLAGLGCIRTPATVNRHKRVQPRWDVSDDDSSTNIITPPRRDSAEVSAKPSRVASVA